MRPNVIFSLLFLIPIMAWGQPSETMKYLNSWQVKNFAKNSEKIGDIYSSIEYYEAVLQKNPHQLSTKFKLAQLYQQSRNYPVAQQYYHEVFEADKEAYVDALFYRGLMKKMQGDYKGAKEDFSLFSKMIKGSKLQDEFKKRIKNEIDGCDLALKLKEKPLDVFILHLDTSINKAHAEASPFPVAGNKIWYASLKTDKLFYIDVNNDTIYPTRQLFVAQKKGEKWINEGLLDGPFNETNIHVLNPALNPAGNRLYFTKCQRNWKNKMVCAIYLSEKIDGQWSEPVKLGSHINDPKYTSTQPTVGIDSKTQSEVLYFVSDREGGKGGLDIWYSIYNAKKNEFKTPRNAGNKINTFGDEMTPFYDIETHALYFSSDGWPSIGGLDVFKAQGELTQFSSPENIGFPINSSADDLYFVVSKNREGGFFVSNRKGIVPLLHETCCDDIFEYRWANYINIVLIGRIYGIKDSTLYEQLEQQIVDKQFIEELDQETDKVNPLPNKKVDLYVVQGNERIYIKSVQTNDKGEFNFNLEPKKDYKILIDNYGFFNKELTVSTQNITQSDTLRADAIYINIVPLEPIIIKNIYYEYAKWNLTDSSKAILDRTVYKLMVENPRIIVEIASHTDSVSSDEYNLKLSQKRAESVVKYLISKGIEKERLVAKGYGESKPIAPNTNPDGTDNPEGRQKNRRTEFRIIGSLDQYSKIIYEE
ncbi:MAG: OmpA family protein [Bacteroidales bacterium]|nr:OmpA family protein [Bacteroidales bacterium]